MLKKFLAWLDDRSNYRQFLSPITQRVLPDGPHWFLSTASCLWWLLVVQFVTGFLLMATYSPSITSAWASVHYIERTAAGSFIRGLHFYSAQALIVLFALHLIRVLLTVAFRAPRELIWITGLFLIPLGAIWAITGNPLAGTQTGLAQIEVEGNIIAATPVVGPFIQRLLIGGGEVGHLTLTHLYFLHVGLLPLIVIVLLAVHISQVYRHGLSPTSTAEGSGSAQPYWPYQTVRNLTVLAAVLGAVAILAWRFGAPLDAPADPQFSHTPRPEWYLLFLFELRRYFTGQWEWIATIVAPLAVLLILLAMPLIDRACTKRMSAAIRFLVVLVGTGGWAGLTLTSVWRDWHDQEYQASRAAAAVIAERARVLAEQGGIPPEGAVVLLRQDAKTQGPLLFARHCAACHSHTDQQGQGIAAQKPSAPNLHGFGTQAWLSGLLDPAQIQGPRYFGHTKFVSGDMVTTILDAFGDTDGEEKDQRRAQSEQVARTLAAEAKLGSQAQADEQAAQMIAEGKKLLAGDLSCTDCHRFHDKGELGQAPDLTNYASKEWLTAMINNPQQARFYPEERNDRMPAFEHLLSPREVELLVDWLRGEWPEAVTSRRDGKPGVSSGQPSQF